MFKSALATKTSLIRRWFCIQNHIQSGRVSLWQKLSIIFNIAKGLHPFTAVRFSFLSTIGKRLCRQTGSRQSVACGCKCPTCKHAFFWPMREHLQDRQRRFHVHLACSQVPTAAHPSSSSKHKGRTPGAGSFPVARFAQSFSKKRCANETANRSGVGVLATVCDCWLSSRILCNTSRRRNSETTWATFAFVPALILRL